MELIGENRIIVKNNLENILNTNNIGLSEIIKINNLEKITSYHLGFIIGPCFNASGRLSTAKKAINLLRCRDAALAHEMAVELKELNDARKSMTMENVQKAVEMLESSEKIDKVLVIYLEDCHESLAGIIAGRLRDKYSRPVIVLTKGEEFVKGSARSIEEYNMFEELLKCSEYLERFGGHPMAAGLSLKEENIERLREALNEKTTLTEQDLIPKVSIDAVLPLGLVTNELINELQMLEPCGKNNEKPLFAERNLRFNSAKILGKNGNVLKFSVINDYNKTMDAIFFGNIEEFNNYVTEKYGEEQLQKMYKGLVNDVKLSVVYSPAINEYNGRKTIQIQIKEYM